MRRVDDTDGDHHLQARLPEPRFCCSVATWRVGGVGGVDGVWLGFV